VVLGALFLEPAPFFDFDLDFAALPFLAVDLALLEVVLVPLPDFGAVVFEAAFLALEAEFDAVFFCALQALAPTLSQTAASRHAKVFLIVLRSV
jgi:hypothetical protein